MVGLADPEQCKSQLSIGWDALEKSAKVDRVSDINLLLRDAGLNILADFEDLLPLRDCSVKPVEPAGDDGITKKYETDDEGRGLDKRVGRNDQRSCKQGNDERDKTEPVDFGGERRGRGQSTAECQ